MTPAYWVVLMLALVTTIYVGAAIAYQFAARPGMAIAFAGYVVANLGLIWDALAK